ncbi:uncharacterized protein A1O9_08522 [Exophiala aquamarina CBS 119918]|uniref:Uncharacterized protein n=1 Tax=Exophiala aquamarina CBS 119918 TaxID=1182545 RepID=A0A072P7I9_9EURO|nr:uncharacterized protein A1O9_08522 [Exophiala aquamarina CBS 119918]KEF55771.1 hypothetical protein A1O9_08522 [Exophiala aquamarina CBS 119918]
MAKSLLQSTLGFVSSIFSFGSSSEQSSNVSTSNVKPSFQPRKRKAVDHSDDDDDDADDYTPSSKRRRLYKGRPDFIPYSSEDDPVHFSPSTFPRQSATALAKAERDRAMMPPPATPVQVPSDTDPSYQPRDDDAISFLTTGMTRRRPEDLDEEQMEAARRHAASIQLPAESGKWSEAEQELFFRLAKRGFQPLLPQNWMIDFDTLPLSIFAHEDSIDPPLIQNMRDNHFRAAHALRRLLEAGHDVRDRTHVSPGVRRERILQSIVKRYLHWALTDVGLRPNSLTRFLPTHVIVTHRKGHSTFQTLEELAHKLHKLADRHRKAAKVHPTIEPHESQLIPCDPIDAVQDSSDIPTLFGLVFISSVLAIMTLSPFTADKSITHNQTGSQPISQPVSNDYLRTIIDLDFSQKDQDVWNSLGVAIVAMQIRDEALKANTPEMTDDAWDGASILTSRYGEDDMESQLGDIVDPDL